MILRALKWLWHVDLAALPIRAFNFLWFRTFGYEEHLRATLELETKQVHRVNVQMYADLAEILTGGVT